MEMVEHSGYTARDAAMVRDVEQWLRLAQSTITVQG